jgi:drug/metabolite transporter (DMT)-like permease
MPLTIINSTRSIISLDILSLVLLLFVGIVHTGIAYLLYFSSVKEIEGQSIAILSYMDPIFALLIAGLFLGEKMTIIQLFGGILTVTNSL